MDVTRKNIAVITDTRINTISLAPVIQELQRYEQYCSVIPVTLARKREELDDLFTAFSFIPKYDLRTTELRRHPAMLVQQLMEKMDYLLAMERPDMLLVRGKSAAAFAVALTAIHRNIPVAYVSEDVLGDELSHSPRHELYRRLASHLVNIHFVLSAKGFKPLLAEGILKKSIVCTGDSFVDAVKLSLRPKLNFTMSELNEVIASKLPVIFATIHRREHLDESIIHIASTITELASQHSEKTIIFSAQLNHAVRDTVHDLLRLKPNIHWTEPLAFGDAVNVIAQASVVIADAEDILACATVLGKPVLFLTGETEPDSAALQGIIRLPFNETRKILVTANTLLTGKRFHQAMMKAGKGIGDGKASSRIAASILHFFNFPHRKVTAFATVD